MELGFTGTASGMTEAQKKTFKHFLDECYYEDGRLGFHHGDCIGADAEAHDIVDFHQYNWAIIGHPPINPKSRAFKECDQLREEKEYLDRNHDIVDETEALVVTPKTQGEILRSGTWATYRYAMQQKKAVIIIYPDGSVRKFN